MSALIEFVDADDVRNIQLDILADRTSDYLRTGQHGLDPPDAIRQRIRRVSDSDIRRILERQDPEAFHRKYRAWQKKVFANMKKSGDFKPL